jgi:hypothetical protein
MDPTCSTWSLEVGEPLAGTAAAQTEFWVVLEHAGPWGPKGADDSGLPAEVVAHLARFTKAEPRARVQLIRRPERSGEPPTVYLARGTPNDSALFSATLARIEDVSELDLASFAKGALPSLFRQSHEPLFLVCVHGRRDRCCAQRGMPVYSALSALAPERVFQTTHLGGHRFAATLLVLPEGICYGRVEAGEAAGLIAAHQSQRMHSLSLVRGRCAYAPAAQAAEVRLREDLNEHALSALTLLEVASDDANGEADVRFRHDVSGREHSVRVRKQPLAPSAQSCGATPRASEGLLALTSR